jgi:hypothetical protein
MPTNRPPLKVRYQERGPTREVWFPDSDMTEALLLTPSGDDRWTLDESPAFGCSRSATSSLTWRLCWKLCRAVENCASVTHDGSFLHTSVHTPPFGARRNRS